MKKKRKTMKNKKQINEKNNENLIKNNEKE